MTRFIVDVTMDVDTHGYLIDDEKRREAEEQFITVGLRSHMFVVHIQRDRWPERGEMKAELRAAGWTCEEIGGLNAEWTSPEGIKEYGTLEAYDTMRRMEAHD